MKKNKMMRLAAILLVMALLSTAVISGTFAKYTSEATTTDSARVAKWIVSVNDVALGSASKEFDFDLFDCADTNVKMTGGKNVGDDGKKLVAPGTKGSFDIVIKNESEVNAEYAVAFTSTLNDVPIKLTIDDVALADIEFTAIGMGETKTVTVNWEWTFEAGRDAADTELGLDPVEVTVAAVVTVQQVD